MIKIEMSVEERNAILQLMNRAAITGAEAEGFLIARNALFRIVNEEKEEKNNKEKKQ